ncbi:MAG: ComF family protein [Solirubrobacterales bacterium]
MAVPVRGILGALGAALAPALCWSCRGPAAGGGPLCRTCEGLLPWLDPRVPASTGSAGALPALERAWAPLSYEGVARDLVHALKFSGAAGVAPAMARQACDALPPRAFPPRARLVPVPADRGRRRRRGFDHAEALAGALSDLTGLPVARVLARERAQRAGQRGLGRPERLRGQGISVRARRPAPPACVLVDDVMTTGATARACARALRANGANSVVFVAYCRVL